MTAVWIIVGVAWLGIAFVAGMLTVYTLKARDRQRWREQHRNAIDDVTREDSQ